MIETKEFYFPILGEDGRQFDELGPLQAIVDADEYGTILEVDDIFSMQLADTSATKWRKVSLSRRHPLWPEIEQHIFSIGSEDIIDPDDLPDGVDDAKEHGFGKFEYGLS